MEVEMTDPETLTSTIKDVLLRCNLQLCQCRGKSYDRASKMAGHISVSTRITAAEPRALYVHCLAHSWDLCLQDCYSRYCDCVKNALSLASDLIWLG